MLDPNVTPREDVEITRCNEIRDLFPRQYQQVWRKEIQATT